MKKINGESKSILRENINKIKELFPSIESDGKIDFDKLRILLDDDIDNSNERYNFTWNGKTTSIIDAQRTSQNTLIPEIEKSVNFDNTKNIYIEGDNLESLKILQKTYYNKIKLIYIDPPYNTGNNIIYKNDYEMDLETLKKNQNQNLVSGGEYFKNTYSSATFHTEWLNMMYPRIMLARNLLSDDGVAVFAIDHNELMNLIKISDEIFGESNRLGIVTVVHKPEGRNQEKFFATSNEYALFYAKNKNIFEFEPAILDDKIKKQYKYKDNKGYYKLSELMRNKDGAHFGNINLENFNYPIFVDGDNNIYLEEPLNINVDAVYPVSKTGRQYRWRMIKETTKKLLEENELIAHREGKLITIYEKYRVERGQLIKTHWVDTKYNATAHGTRVLDSLMGIKTFDFPKSINLMKDIIRLTTKKDSIILDLFSGSATTAQAMFEINEEEGTDRRFILIQLPEEIDKKTEAYKAGYKVISDIGRERIRKSGNSLIVKTKNNSNLDLGFKSFKLDSSNIRSWDSSIKYNKQTLFDSINVFKEDRNEEDILYEILLKTGTFNQDVEKVKINNKLMYSIGKGYSIVCLIDDVRLDDIKEIGKLKPVKVVFKESGFKDDNVKLNSLHTLSLLGIQEVISI